MLLTSNSHETPPQCGRLSKPTLCNTISCYIACSAVLLPLGGFDRDSHRKGGDQLRIAVEGGMLGVCWACLSHRGEEEQHCMLYIPIAYSVHHCSSSLRRL